MIAFMPFWQRSGSKFNTWKLEQKGIFKFSTTLHYTITTVKSHILLSKE